MLKTFKDYYIKEDIKKDIIIDGLLKSNGVFLVVSLPKVGKSFFALQLAYSISNNIPFMGHEILKSSPVLYITTDLSGKQLTERAFTLGMDINKENFFIIEGEESMRVNLNDIEYLIKEFAEEQNGKAMVIDMIKDIDFGVSYDINSYQDVAQNLMPKIKNLANKYNIVIILVHHMNKMGTTLGSIGFEAVVDGTIKLSRSKYDEKTIKMETESRHFPNMCEYLTMDKDGILSIAPDGYEDYINPNLVQLIKIVIAKKSFDTTIGELLEDPKLVCRPTQLGKLINNNRALLANEGITFSEYRTSKGRTYHFEYHEPSLENE